MTHTVVRFDLEDFESWKDTFEARTGSREENGCLDETLFTRSDNRQKVVLLAEWDSAANAEAYFDGSDFRQAMRVSGVARKPTVTYLDRLEDIAHVSSDPDAATADSVNQEPSKGESSSDEPDQ